MNFERIYLKTLTLNSRFAGNIATRIKLITDSKNPPRP